MARRVKEKEKVKVKNATAGKKVRAARKRKHSQLKSGQKDIAGLASFFKAAIQLKSVNRAGWIEKAGVTTPESVADHTFSMCTAAMVLADMAGLDTEKTLKMAILHDMAESLTGDYMPEELRGPDKLAIEHRAMKAILSGLAPAIRSQYEKIWQEYVANRTPVARLVHAIDKFEMAMQAAQYARQDYAAKLLWQFFNSAKKAISSAGKNGRVGQETLDRLLIDILDQHFKVEYR